MPNIELLVFILIPVLFLITVLESGVPEAHAGTSYSAPTANGISACVRAANGIFNSWPEIVRVAFMLTAKNVDGGYWNSSVDGLDGAGVVSGSSAVNGAQNATQVNPNMTSGVAEVLL